MTCVFSACSARRRSAHGSLSAPERTHLIFVGAAAPRMTAETIIAITVGTAMTIETSALRIASIEASTGMNDGRITWRAAFTSGSRAPQTKPKAFEFGSALRMTSSSSSMSIWFTQLSMQARRFACVSGTAFGSPVMPEV